MKKTMCKLLALALIPVFVLCGCGKAADDAATTAADSAAASGEHTRVQFTMKDGGTFTMEMYPEYAPKTVENFLKLVNEGFYDGLTFHRVFPGFMAQGGDPAGNGTGGSDETIPGEFPANGFTQNTLSHTRGVVSMARGNDPDSASSQFFICYSDNAAVSCDGKYAAFGKVIEGMEVVDAFTEVELAYTPSDYQNTTPVEPIVIDHVVVL